MTADRCARLVCGGTAALSARRMPLLRRLVSACCSSDRCSEHRSIRVTSAARVTSRVIVATPLRRHIGILAIFLTIAAPWSVFEGVAGHGAAPPHAAPVPGLPLSYCRPLHLSAEPSEFRPGQVARRFLIFVDRECVRRTEPVAIEVWYRAPYQDGAGRVAFGMPYLVAFVQTRTDLAVLTPHVTNQLPHFDVPGEGFRLHPGCYVARIRIAAPADDRSSQAVRPVEHADEIERCAAAPRLSLP